MDTSPIPPSPIPPAAPVPTPEPVKHRQLPWLAAILSLLVLSIIGVLVFQNLRLKNYDKKYQECIKNGGGWAESFPPQCIYSTSSPSPTVSQAPNEDLSDWKTYINEKYGFEFKYPLNLYLFETDNYRPAIAILSTVQLKELPIEGPYGQIVFGFNQCMNTTTNETYPCEKSVFERIADMQGVNPNKGSYISKEYSLGGRTGAQIRGFPEGPSAFKETIVPYGDYLFIVGLFQKEDLEPTYDQILSTFQFLD